MYAQVAKPKENKSRAATPSVAQEKGSGEQAFGLVDNRPEAVAQRELIQMMQAGKARPGNAPSVSQEKGCGEQAFALVDNRPEAVAQREVSQMMQTGRVRLGGTVNAINTSGSVNPIQRTLNIGGADIPDAEALPEAATAIINAIGDTTTQGQITTVINAWRGDEVPRAYDSWTVAIANAFMHFNKWNLADVTIVDPALTPGNCHGLTFGQGGATFIEFGSPQEVLDRWNHETRIMVCLKGEKVAHTATFAGGVWRQTLPRGPIFTSTREALEARYICYDTGIEEELGNLQALAQAQEQAEAEAEVEAAAAYVGIRAAHIARLQQVVNGPQGDEEYFIYAENWLAAAQEMEEYSAVNLSTIQDHEEQLDDMGCPKQ